MTKARIESEQLNAIYKKWVAQQRENTNTFNWYNTLDRTNLKYGLGKQFDDYVWSCGGRIYQEHGKRFAEFFEESDLTLFALKHL